MQLHIVELDTGFHLVGENIRIFLGTKEAYEKLTLKEFKSVVRDYLKERRERSDGKVPHL